MAVRIAVAGAAGRMGQRITALACEDSELELVAALEQAQTQTLGVDAGELAGVGSLSIPVADKTDATFDALIDFTLPDGTMHWLEVCQTRNCAMVIGTTGHSPEQTERIRQSSGSIPILMAPNMSVGVNVMLRVAEMLGRLLDPSYDVEIVEAHHRFKVDAPSGTALALRDAVAEGRTNADGGGPSVVYGRHGETGARPLGEIGMHSMRIGDTVGEHTVSFGTLGETVTLGHVAHSRDTFVLGALRAAKWIAGRNAGLYSMRDVLFSNQPGV